ncbi:MAG TPA: alpha/beta hydrolase [Bacilli bacterium]|nr:alpha/beta hydrolase [Bacilli bacterium]
MNKRKHKTKLIIKSLLLVIYFSIVSFLLASGFAVRTIINQHQYVADAYAKRVTVNDVEYFYREAGETNLDTIVMIHGFLGSSYDFIDTIENLKTDYRVIAVDLIGFGLSEKSSTFDYSKKNQADYLVDFLDVLDITSATIIAHSMGGEVSIHLAHDYPTYVERMILIGSAGYYEETTSNFNLRLPLFFYDHVFNNYYIQRVFFYSAYSKHEVDLKLVTYNDFDEMFFVNRTIPGNVLRKMTTDNDAGATNAKLENVEQDTLLIWGEFDGFIPLSTGQLLQEALGDNAQLIIIPNAGHLPFDTYFDDFIAYVRTFLAN